MVAPFNKNFVKMLWLNIKTHFYDHTINQLDDMSACDNSGSSNYWIRSPKDYPGIMIPTVSHDDRPPNYTDTM